MPGAYSLVHLRNGSQSVRDLNVGETFHPVVGPAEETGALYLNQLRLVERLREA
ncbi:MAG: methyltransferase, partial [Verrucomicrobia bacterium]|nr:methyltransferase [Verrucomicrobiota bacterium]